MQGTFGFIITLLCGYVAVCLLVALNQSRLLYLPLTRTVSHTPAAIGLAYEPVLLTTADGLRLAGWYIPPPEEGGGVILFCHGNAGNIGHRLDSLRIFHRLGWGVLIFDYRGYGESEGRPSEAGTYLDSEAAWRYLVEARGVGEERIVFFGRSLGGAVAAELAGSRRPAGLIVESTFTSVPDMAAILYPWLPIRLLSRFRYDARAAIAKVRCPVLVVHSRDDEIIPYGHGEALYRAAPEPKTLLSINGDHNAGFLLSGARYQEGVAAFLAGVRAGSPVAPPPL